MVLKWIQAEEDHAEVEDCTAGVRSFFFVRFKGFFRPELLLCFFNDMCFEIRES